MHPSSRLSRRQLAAALGAPLLGRAQPPVRPNILWITCEDIGPHLGCYGDSYSQTPNLDRLASTGILYRNAWSNAPVCAPARTTIITGVYPPCTGSEHMRSFTRLPDGMKMFPEYLREAGYYTSNNVKEDYNLEKPGRPWDDSSGKAHWRNRSADQPFFSVFNLEITHESQIRKRPHELVHDPTRARVPPYHPDTPEVRRDWAQYYDNITTMDTQAARILADLEKDGLSDSTIIFFYGDHGSGMPRHKRCAYNSGLRVPMIVHVPPAFARLAPRGYRAGEGLERLVSFVDLAPTVLSLAGVTPPAFMQGTAFAGRFARPEPQYLFGFRGRMDERHDLIRSVRDRRYVYVRNYMPHKPLGQHVEYMFETPTTQVWKRLYDEGKLNDVQSAFWRSKAPEELYDLETDADEIVNLAHSPGHRFILRRMRNVHHEHVLHTRDLGFLPEDELHSRSGSDTPYTVGRDDKRYPLERVLRAADLASGGDNDAGAELAAMVTDSDSAVRYWAVTGLMIRGRTAIEQARPALLAALSDPTPSVRVAAAEALGRYGNPEDIARALAVLAAAAPPDKNGVYVSMQALNAIDELGRKADPIRERVAAIAQEDPRSPQRTRTNVPKLLRHIAGRQPAAPRV